MDYIVIALTGMELMKVKSYLRSSWRPSFHDIWLAGSGSDSAGPLGTTDQINSGATARHEQQERKQNFWVELKQQQ